MSFVAHTKFRITTTALILNSIHRASPTLTSATLDEDSCFFLGLSIVNKHVVVCVMFLEYFGLEMPVI